MEREERCERCRFWEEWEDEAEAGVRIGSCMRYAPRPREFSADGAAGLTFGTDWPNTYAHQWCGEFQAKKADWVDFFCQLPRPIKKSFDLGHPWEPIDSFDKLLSHSESDLLGRSGIGSASALIVKKSLAALGLKLKGD